MSWRGGAKAPGLALLAVFVFSVFPLTIRYGRAFQPDASMLGATVAGLACWDRRTAHGQPGWLLAGWCLIALGFAIKITSGFLLIPLLLLIARSGRRWEMFAACTTLVPGVLWYLWADHLIGQGVGSRASCRQPLATAGRARPVGSLSSGHPQGGGMVSPRSCVHAVGSFSGGRRAREAGATPMTVIVGFGASGVVRHWQRWGFLPESCTTSITGSR